MDVSPSNALGRHRQGTRGIAELAIASKHISKGMPGGFYGQSLAFSRAHGHIQINRIGCNSIHRALFSPKTPANDADVSSVIVGDLGNVVGLDLLISRSGHLEPRGKIRPQLESVHPSGSVALGHFLVNDAASGSHPLHIAGRDGSVIPHAVAMFDGPGEHIRDRLNATVGMPGKSSDIVFGNIVAK